MSFVLLGVVALALVVICAFAYLVFITFESQNDTEVTEGEKNDLA